VLVEAVDRPAAALEEEVEGAVGVAEKVVLAAWKRVEAAGDGVETELVPEPRGEDDVRLGAETDPARDVRREVDARVEAARPAGSDDGVGARR
jgi:hypothetical protein